MIRLRHTDEGVGLLVILALVIFAGVLLEAGVLRDWFRPVSRLRIVLPQSGVAGLAVGSEIEVLGIHAGTVRRVVLNPNQQIYAEADIDEQATAFIRRDSHAVIRRRFALAGATFIDIARGTGAPLDWSYAVIEATTERAPTDTLSAMVDEIHAKLMPMLDDLKRTMSALAGTAENLQRGQGTIGRLLTDDTLIRQTEDTVAAADRQIAALAPAMTRLDDIARQTDALMQQIASGKEGVPEALRRVNAILKNLQTASVDISKLTPELPKVARNVVAGTDDLPSLLTQIEVAAVELEKLLHQLRGMWLLGGAGGSDAAEPSRPPSKRLRP